SSEAYWSHPDKDFATRSWERRTWFIGLLRRFDSRENAVTPQVECFEIGKVSWYRSMNIHDGSGIPIHHEQGGRLPKYVAKIVGGSARKGHRETESHIGFRKLDGHGIKLAIDAIPENTDIRPATCQLI